MTKFLRRRAFYMLLTVWVITIVSFGIIQLPPGDYVSSLIQRMESQSGIDFPAEQEAALREQYGMDQPLPIQYVRWISNIVFQGNFGYSFIYKRDAVEIIMERLPMSFAISAFSFMFVWIVSLPIGIFSAVRKYSLADYVITFIGFIGLTVPNFLLALILMYVGYRYFGQAQIGLFSQEYADAPWSLAKFGDMLAHMWIPVIIIGVGGTAGLIRTLRANLLDELNKPYVDTARAKGLSEIRLLLKYPVRHAMNPFISTIGWVLPGLIAGEVIVSRVLNLPTSGPVILEALIRQDMYVAAGFLLVLSTLTVIGTFVSDILLAWLDPRIRLA